MQVLLSVVPQVSQLDGTSTNIIMSSQPDMVAAQQFAAERLRMYEPVADGTVSVSHQQQQYWQDRTLGVDPTYPTSQLRTPHLDAAMSGYYQRQQGSGANHQNLQGQQQQVQKQPANWYQQQGGVPGGGRRPKAGEGWMTGDSGRTSDQFTSSHKVYISDAAVQTVDMNYGPNKQLRAECTMLKQQLIQLTGNSNRNLGKFIPITARTS